MNSRVIAALIAAWLTFWITFWIERQEARHAASLDDVPVPAILSAVVGVIVWAVWPAFRRLMERISAPVWSGFRWWAQHPWANFAAFLSASVPLVLGGMLVEWGWPVTGIVLVLVGSLIYMASFVLGVWRMWRWITGMDRFFVGPQ